MLLNADCCLVLWSKHPAGAARARLTERLSEPGSRRGLAGWPASQAGGPCRRASKFRELTFQLACARSAPPKQARMTANERKRREAALQAVKQAADAGAPLRAAAILMGC